MDQKPVSAKELIEFMELLSDAKLPDWADRLSELELQFLVRGTASEPKFVKAHGPSNHMQEVLAHELFWNETLFSPRGLSALLGRAHGLPPKAPCKK